MYYVVGLMCIVQSSTCYNFIQPVASVKPVLHRILWLLNTSDLQLTAEFLLFCCLNAFLICDFGYIHLLND